RKTRCKDGDFVAFRIISQGPLSKNILLDVIDSGHLPEPRRNCLSTTAINGAKVQIARTGYTGEPICFELFVSKKDALMIWDLLIDKGAQPVGLGARDTLRLEASLPLYGHELGDDPEGNEIPIFASSLSKFAVSLSPLKGEFIGRQALEKQFKALKKIINHNFSLIKDLPRIIMPVAIVGKGLARNGYRVYHDGEHVGYVTSGTMVPYWKYEGVGIFSKITDKKGLRAVCLAFINSDLDEGDELKIEIRSKMTDAVVVPYHMRSEAPPFARAISHDQIRQEKPDFPSKEAAKKVRSLLDEAIENTLWRQHECINLIPSEQTPSEMVKLLSIMDPVGRYAEHKQVLAFSEAEVFYYQGTEFIAKVEEVLKNELRLYLECAEIETRPVSGQMANTALFSAMVDFINRADRKSEQRRIRKVLNNHIIKGGHLSAQPMGALRDFVARNPKWEKPAVVNFPVLEDNPYKIDVAACKDIIEEHKPELIIFGKSMTGPHFQQPFKEGADIVTGSTHKTFYGTQRGIIGSDYTVENPCYELWEAIQRRAFPGSVSNHHLGTMLGLLMGTYEMNYFKDEYQRKVHANAKAFAKALKECGLDVAGDPDISYTETHQVILNVGYSKGPEFAQRLEENNIIVNYQAAPEEEGFTASGSLRMGVQEMTRFGMVEKDFQKLAQLIRDAIIGNKVVKEEIKSFRE
ncbi:MAG: glycine cleavage system protein T, partial [Deltaproteobacteria bacterium]|nr:glycine cleavage system protein T [Deltaproteobacteria bacterium]